MIHPASPGHAGASFMAYAPFEAVMAQLKAMPGMAAHLEGIDLDGDGIPDLPLEQRPSDPAGSRQWYATIKAEKHRSAQRKLARNHTLLAYLEAHDPLFRHVSHFVDCSVAAMPPRLRQVVLDAVAHAPGTFVELYEGMRRHLVREFGLHGKARVFTDQTSPAATHAAAEPRRAGRRTSAGRMSPPSLECAGMMDDRLSGASRAAELAELKARCKAGKAREGDLLRYLELNWRGRDE